jgi:AcrR family transcriptional regulator
VSQAEGGDVITRSTDNSKPRETLTRERVLRAAAEFADERGIDSLTMRELGRRLGVEAASLYNHVAGKDDLLDGLVELAVSAIEVPADVHWKEAMRREAVSTRKLFVRHSWAAALIDSRERTGPNSLSRVDRVLGVLMRAGFSPAEAANATLILNSYIYGFERQRPTPSIKGDTVSTEEAHEVLAAIPEGAYPNAARVAMEYATTLFDLDAAFDFGLTLILDGLERSLGRQ